MTEKYEVERITRRRAFSLLGLAATAGFVVPATILSVSDATGQTAGMERRDDRRQGRQDRRHTRQEGRHARRDTRRGGGKETETTGAK